MSRAFLFIILTGCILHLQAQAFIPGSDSAMSSIPSDDEIIYKNPGNASNLFEDSIINLETAALQDLQKEAQRKVNNLSTYISLIGTKDPAVTRDQKLSAINQSLKLFLDENRIIEVSNVSSKDIQPYPVRTYLERIRMLPYATVEIKWSNIYIAKDLIKVSDSPLAYEGIISVVQTFKGCYKESQACYQDVTYKNIKIRVEAESVYNGQDEDIYFVVKLGNTSVTETRDR